MSLLPRNALLFKPSTCLFRPALFMNSFQHNPRKLISYPHTTNLLESKRIVDMSTNKLCVVKTYTQVCRNRNIKIWLVGTGIFVVTSVLTGCVLCTLVKLGISIYILPLCLL